MKVSAQKLIEQKVIKNLLSAQERIADEGSAADVIRITKYLLRLAKKFGDVLVDVVPEQHQQRGA